MMVRKESLGKKDTVKTSVGLSNKKPDNPSKTLFNHVNFLHKTIGNQAVQRLFESGVIQAKLRIGKPNDIYEQEADRVAEQVMWMPEPAIQPT